MQLALRIALRTTIATIVPALFAGACASATAVSGPTAFPRAPAPSVAAGGPDRSVPAGFAVAETALSFVGTPYRLGGETPRNGFDCSGLVRYALAQHHVDVPRTVSEQYAVGRPVDKRDLQPGDLIFFSTIGPGATHVGIVLDEPNSFVHAPSEGGAVRVERFDTSYWRTRFVGARRIF